MEIEVIVKEIQKLPLTKRFFVMEQTLKSIKNEELGQKVNKTNYYSNKNDTNDLSFLVNHKSLSQVWDSEEDSRWDNFL